MVSATTLGAMAFVGCAGSEESVASGPPSAARTTIVGPEADAGGCVSYTGAEPTVGEFRDAYLSFMDEVHIADAAEGTFDSSDDRSAQALQMFADSPDGVRPSVQEVFERVPKGGAARYTQWTCAQLDSQTDRAPTEPPGNEMTNPAMRLFGGLLTCVDAHASEDMAELPPVNVNTLKMLCPDAQG